MDEIASRVPADRSALRTPRHLWLVAGVGFLWNGLGCVDFLLTNMRIPACLAHLSPDMIDFVDAMPGWAICAWAMSVGFALLGSAQLFERSRLSVYAFAGSLAALGATQLNQLATELPPGMNTPLNWSITIAIWVVAIALQVYAICMRRRGVLR